MPNIWIFQKVGCFGDTDCEVELEVDEEEKPNAMGSE